MLSGVVELSCKVNLAMHRSVGWARQSTFALGGTKKPDKTRFYGMPHWYIDDADMAIKDFKMVTGQYKEEENEG